MSERLYFDGREYFDSLIEGINRSRVSVDLETYTFDLGRTGTRVLHALIEAAHRGVRVRLMVDGFGCWGWAHRIAGRLAATPVQFKVYHPMLIDSTILTRKAWRNLSRRNHRKTCLIDSHEAWVGSFNVSDVHTSRTHWRDTAILIQSGDFGEIARAFESAWDQGHYPRHHSLPKSRERFLLNTTSEERRKRNRRLAARIRRARRRVWVTTPYFSPDHTVIAALRQAAERGADVRLLLPDKSDVPASHWVNSVFYRSLYRSGLKVFLYRSSILHAKTILADEWAIVGSSNLNHRSWLHDLEVDAVVVETASLQALEAQFKLDLEKSQEIRIEDPTRDFWVNRAVSQVALWLRRWT